MKKIILMIKKVFSQGLLVIKISRSLTEQIVLIPILLAMLATDDLLFDNEDEGHPEI